MVSITLLLNVLIKYNNIRKAEAHQTKRSPSQKPAYLMIICYFILTSSASFFHAFIRTNALTRISDDQFTDIQCNIGFLFSYLMYYSSVALLYFIFIWRINTVLNSTAYAYPPGLSWSLYSCIAIMTLLWWFNVIYHSVNAKWGTMTHHDVSICVNFLSDIDDSAAQFSSILAMTTAIFHLAMNSILLLMFVRGLWSINKLFIKVYVSEHCDAANQNRGISIVLDQRKTGNKPSSQSNKASDQQVSHILKLHDLIKKQTILVTISAISSVILWILAMVNDWFYLQIYWDVAINSICVWFMLGSSQRYWTFCTKTCMRCFYLKENVILAQQ